MIKRIGKLFRRWKTPPATLPQRRTVVLTEHCLQEITQGMQNNVQRRHEGIAYLIGLTTGTTTLAVSARFPDAATTLGSFDVANEEMAKVVGEAAGANLQVVGQIHTHPVDGFHSKGDLEGMRIKYPGYFSLVVPNYGTFLPSLQDSHTLMWGENEFQDVSGQVKIL